MKVHGVQEAALAASDGKDGFAYFMEQGLGKTYTTLLDFQRAVSRRDATRLVVVCPNSFKGGWVDEINKWAAPITPFIWDPSREDALRHWLRTKFNMAPALIVNYEAIRSEKVQDYIRAFIAPKPSMIVFDESVQIKTHNSAQTKAAISLSKDFAVKRDLSGKPITQGPHDLWGQMRAIGALNGHNFYAFKTTFCRMGGFKMKQVVGAQNEEYLARLIDPYVFRATKAEWTDLPPKVYTTREYRMTPKMQAEYDSMEEDFIVWVTHNTAVTADIAITKYIKLAQIQAGFVIDELGEVNELVAPHANPRVILLKDIIDTEVVGKTTIVYNHKHVFDVLMSEMSYLRPAYIRGGMSTSEIDEQKRRFNEDPSCRTILLQTRAAKYGHTLLGGSEPVNRCSTSIIFENTYSLDDRSQIEDRIHRHGQTADSVIYIDLSGSDLDKRMAAALQRKEDVFQSVFAHIGNS